MFLFFSKCDSCRLLLLCDFFLKLLHCSRICVWVGCMAGNVNKAMIVSILGVDPEVRQLNAGQQMAHLRVATSERWHDRATGEQRERTEWHQVTVFDEQAISYAADYLRKGSRVFIEVKVETRR